jgi:peptide/nickel transport system permease protein
MEENNKNNEIVSEYSLKGILREVLSYRAGVASLIILCFFFGLILYTVTTFPYSEAIHQWNSSNAHLKNPRNAAPVWWGIFSGKNLPRNTNITLNSTEGNPVTKEFSFNYDDFPTEINIFFKAKYSSVPPVVKIYWERPDGEKLLLKEHTIRSEEDTLYLSNDFSLENRLNDDIISKIGKPIDFSITVPRGLFMKYSDKLEVFKGNYKITFDTEFANRNDSLDGEVVIYGELYGIAGTDHLRRPIQIALLWGTPLDLSFGLGASLSITLVELIVASVSGWFGGAVDSLIQRLTEIYMVLPFLPIMIMISLFYKLNIWSLLFVVILLSIFGSGIKTTRAMVLQVKTLPYIEAAQAYGASNWRIIFLYIIPKILPPVIPNLVASVPVYVFLEAILALFGVLDPTQPTWGRVLEDAFQNGALYKGYTYWVLVPSALLILTAISFSLLGFVLDRVVNPKLKEL